MPDDHGLERFVEAQRTVYANVLAELKQGRKRSHWMWFIFPQIAGLGLSPMAQRYAIASLEEARAYLAHEVLGPRLLECTRLVSQVQGKSINAILGSPDDLKFRSSMTLFAEASGHPIFGEALAQYYPQGKDEVTLDILSHLR